jgi:hypothetical protein
MVQGEWKIKNKEIKKKKKRLEEASETVLPNWIWIEVFLWVDSLTWEIDRYS